MSSLSFLPKVKICGLTRAEDVEEINFAKVDFAGFIIEAKSPRKLTIHEAFSLSEHLSNCIKTVAVTVNADIHLIDAIVKVMRPDYIQLHGDETVSQIAAIRRLHGHDIKIIKAVPVASDADMKTAGEYAGLVDFILYDAKPPKGSQVRGGHGVSIDWDIIARAPTPKTFALAGGLNTETVGEAISKTKAPILDVSSGVESAPGVKDVQKIQAFMKAVKSHG